MRAGVPEDKFTDSDRAAWTASSGLHRALPHLSARRRLHVTQVLTFLVLCIALAVALRAAPGPAQTALRITAFATFSILTMWRLRQRARWIKGHLQTWLVLMRDPITSAREMGAGGFLSMQIMLGGSLLSAFAHGPIFVLVAWALISPSFNLDPIAWSLALAGYAIAAYNAISVAAALRDPRLAFAALTMPFYWPLSTIAALMAGLDFLFRPHYWAKTQHGAPARSHLTS